MQIIHIHPQDSVSGEEQLHSIWAACLRALEGNRAASPKVSPAQRRGR